MNTKIFSQTGSYAGIGFALPANKMIEVASEIVQYGSVNGHGLEILESK
jgi:S1-C subfamily serine protease